MKRNCLILVVWGALLASCQTAGNDRPAASYLIGYSAHGNEPFWSLKISRKTIQFKDQTGRIEEKIDPAHLASNQLRDGYRSEKVSFWTNHIECLDRKTGLRYETTVTVRVRSISLRGCGGAALNRQSNDLDGTNWRIDWIDNQAAKIKFATQVRFVQGRMIAHVGCNKLSRDYDIKDGKLSVGSLQSSNFECSEADERREQKFLEITGDGAKYEFDYVGNLIIESHEKGKIMMIQTL
jgi:uncharacterized membrane protein